MLEINPTAGTGQSINPDAAARTSLIVPAPLTSDVVGILNPVLIRRDPSTLVLRLSRGMAIRGWLSFICQWLFLVVLLFIAPVSALDELRLGSWSGTLFFGGIAILLWYGTLRLLVFARPIEASDTFGRISFFRLFWDFMRDSLYLMLRQLIPARPTEAPTARACFDREFQYLSTRNSFGLNLMRHPLGEIGAVQLVSAAGKT
jgi:hypothetical protein